MNNYFHNMKLIIADDHQLIINGLQSVLLDKFPNTEIDSAINKDKLFNLLKNKRYDILIQDLKFGEHNAVDFIKEIKLKHPHLKIIILSSISNSITITKLSNIVDGYVVKSESLEQLSNAIENIVNGEKFFSSLAQKKMNQLQTSNEIILTRREKEVLEVTLQEKSIKEIAKILCISEKTVELHRNNLFVKLDVKNITGLVKKAIALNLIED